MTQNYIACSNCRGTQLHSGMRGWSWMTGILGSRGIRITCLACGFQFKPGQGIDNREPTIEAAAPGAPPKRVSLLTILLWGSVLWVVVGILATITASHFQ